MDYRIIDGLRYCPNESLKLFHYSPWEFYVTHNGRFFRILELERGGFTVDPCGREVVVDYYGKADQIYVPFEETFLDIEIKPA